MRPRLPGLVLLSVVVGACGSTTVPPTLPVPGTPASSVPPSSTPVSAPSPSDPTELDADVDIGGRTMRLVCVGPAGLDEPTILLEAGFGGDTHVWNEVTRAMEPGHRLCAYDRAGVGQSQSAPERSRTAADHVADLGALLEASGLDGPFVIGAHSYGAVVAILFAVAYPDDVAGLLFVDPRSPRVSARFRAALPDVAENEPDSLMQFRYGLDAFETDPVLNRENLNLRQSYDLGSAVLDAPGPAFGDRPVVVLSAGNSFGAQLGLPPAISTTVDAIWLASHQELADASTAGSLEVVPGAGHDIQADRPQAVVDGLERILADLATP